MLTSVPLRSSLPIWQVNLPWHHQGMFMGMHWIWWFLWILTLALLLWAFLYGYRDRSETHRGVERQEAAEDTLRRRFAAGEIDEVEFLRRMRGLRESGARSD